MSSNIKERGDVYLSMQLNVGHHKRVGQPQYHAWRGGLWERVDLSSDIQDLSDPHHLIPTYKDPPFLKQID